MEALVKAVVVTVFPLFLPMWQEGPVTREHIVPGPYPYDPSPSMVVLQERAWPEAGPALRERMAVALRQAGGPEARAMLRRCLERGDDDQVRLTFLQQMSLLEWEPGTELAQSAVRLVDDTQSDKDLRVAAVELYGRVPECDPGYLVELIMQEPDEAVVAAAASVLLDSPRAAGVETTLLLTWCEHGSTAVSARALAALVRRPLSEEHIEMVTRSLVEASLRERYAAAAALEYASPSVLQRLAPVLAADGSAAVRDAVAGAITGVVEGWEPGILLSMAADPDAGVRTRAAGGLALWAMPEARHALTGLLDDPVLAVRQVAENALVRMHPELDVHQAAMAVFRGTAVRARAHAARTLGRTGAVPFGRELMGALEGETEPVLVSGVVHALGSLGAVYAAQSLDTLCSHGSAQVRAAAAEALGKLRVPATYARLMELAFDPDPRVQEASILAMARTESAVFSDVLRQILMDMDPSDGTVIRARERSLACWAAGRLRPVSMPLMDRLVTQATTPVIPLPGGRAFEEDSILITAAFSLVHCAHADARVRPLAETVIAAHMGPEMAFMPNSFELREYGRQALAFYERRPATPGLRPFRRVEFPFGPVEETPEPEPEAPDQEWTE